MPMPKPFYLQLKLERTRRGLSQDDLAERLQCDPRTISRWEQGKGHPRPDMAQKLSELFQMDAEKLGLLPGLETSAALGYYREEMEEAPSTAGFCGRLVECEQLTNWVTEERCRLVVILGLGGMGKTTLAAYLVKLVRPDFPRVFWRSLKNAPPLADLLKACLQFLSPQDQRMGPTTIDEQLTLLVRCLRAQRCLLVLDNLETILRPEEHIGRYRSGYENYAELFRRLGEVEHESCLLLTSREKPAELVALEDQRARVHSLRLTGLLPQDCRNLLRGRILQGSDDQWAELIARYSGNPLALKLVASSIHDMFGDQIAAFLHEQEFVFGNIDDLVHQHFQRLSSPERALIYWLAIEREASTRETIRENQVRMPGEVRSNLLDALGSLNRRSLVELTEDQRFFLQPVILEYATNDLMQLALAEFETFMHSPSSGSDLGGVPPSWQQFAFIKASSIDHVREAQTRQILAPLAERLLALVSASELPRRFALLLERQRQANLPGSYLAGNMLNLLIFLRLDPRGLDCSDLPIRQAYLQNAHLPETNFVRSSFQSVTFTNIFGAVLSLAFHPSGDLLAAGTATGDIWLFQVTGGVPLRTYKVHTDGVWALAFSPDGQFLASGSDDATVCVWNVAAGEAHYRLTHHTERTRAVAFSPDSRMLASGSNDQTICLWEAASGKLLQTLRGHEGWIWSLAFHPSGDLLASGSADQTVRLWDMTGAQPDTCVQIFRGHQELIRAVAFHPSGELLASASDDRTVRLWSLAHRRCEQVLEGHTNRVWSLAFSRDGSLLASGSEDCTVRLWETATSLLLRMLPLHTSGVRAVAFGPADLLVSGSDDQTIRFCESQTGKSLKTLQGYPNRVWCLAFARQSGLLLSGSEDRRVRLWDVRTGECVRTIAVPNHVVRALATSSTSALFASVGEDQHIDLWNGQNGLLLTQLTEHTNWLRAVAFSPDGRWLVSGGEDNRVLLWEVQTKKLVRSFDHHTNWIRALAFSPDNRIVASGSDDLSIRLWNALDGKCLHVMHGHSLNIRALAFHPTQPLLFSASEDKQIKIWNILTGEEIQTLLGHTSRVFGLDIDPSGTRLASCGDDLSIRLWNHKIGTARSIEQAHESRIRSVVYSPDGSLLASCGDDGKVKIWDAETLALRQELASELPYERMNITGAVGLTSVQKAALRTLGAIEE